jgi:hypothetical protein
MREEVFVLGREDGVTNHGRDLRVLAGPPIFGGHLHERLAIDIVDVADPREFEMDKCFQVRQISPVKIDVMESNGDDSGHDQCTNEKSNGGTPA